MIFKELETHAADFKSDAQQSCTTNQRLRACIMPGTALLFLAWATLWATASAVEPFTHSEAPLRDYLIIRNQQSPARFPMAVCRADLYDVPAGTTLLVNSWANFTNDTNIDNAGVTCELHLCDPACPVYDTSRRFDRVGGTATNGGANISRRERHHDVFHRYGRIEIPAHQPNLGVELQCRAYNKNVTGNREWVTVDWCGVDVQAIRSGY